MEATPQQTTENKKDPEESRPTPTPVLKPSPKVSKTHKPTRKVPPSTRKSGKPQMPSGQHEKHSHEFWYQKALKEKDTEKQEYYFKRALRIRQNFLPALMELGNCYLSRAQEYERYDEDQKAKDMAQKAAEQYEKVIKINPDLSNVCLNLGVIYSYYVGNFKKAIYYWEKYLKLVPDSQRSAKIRLELRKLKQ